MDAKLHSKRSESQTPFETVLASFLQLVLLNRDRLCRLSLPWVSAETDTAEQALSREAVQLCGSALQPRIRL